MFSFSNSPPPDFRQRRGRKEKLQLRRPAAPTLPYIPSKLTNPCFIRTRLPVT